MILTLTASESHARQLRARHNQARCDAGERAWPAAPILSLDRYVRDCWLKSWPPDQLLSPGQERLLWQQLLDADETNEALLAPRQLVPRLADSWKRAAAWEIDWRSGPHWSEEQRCFARLAAAFEQRLQREGLITTAQLPDTLRRQSPRGRFPEAIQLAVPLQVLPPDRQRLLRHWQDHGTRIEEPARPPAPPPAAWHCEDRAAQWQAIAAAIRPALDRRIVIAVPRLDAALRAEITLHWRSELAPWVLQGAPDSAPWQFEPADSLADQPAVAAACLALQPAPTDNRFEILSRLLLNPQLFPAEELTATARLEAQLRERGPRFGIGALAPDPADTDHHARRLRQFVACVQGTPRRAGARDWLTHWRQRWQALELATSGPDWPLGEEFDQALLEFCGLDPWLGQVDAATAVGWLQQITGQARFRPTPSHQPTVTICDFRGALGLDADWLILANVDNRQCPAPARPDPLLNLDQQLAVGLPEASARGQLDLAREQLDRLGRQAPRLSVYCALSDTQGAPQSPCPLLPAEWQPAPPAPGREARPVAVLPGEDPVPPLAPERARRQSGGQRIVQAQAYGSFFAFVRHRLNVSALPVPLLGLSPRDQGLWIHAVLRAFWSEHRSQTRLLALSPAELEADLAPRCAALTDRYLPRSRYGEGLRALERDRVLRACLDWLAHEKQRQDPFEVLHCELALNHRIEPLSMDLRIDRIDRCATRDGPRYLIIDYKTGTAGRHRFWETHQCYEPQLPLYAVSDGLGALGVPQVDGICFAHVIDGDPKFVASLNWRSRLIKPQKKPFFTDWEGTLAAWRQRLDELVRDYLAGGAMIDGRQDYRRELAVADLLPLIDTLPEFPVDE